MDIKKGQHIYVHHLRKGYFDAVALRDFDTAIEEWYPLAIAKGNLVKGLSVATYWLPGEEIPCRKSLTTLILIDKE